MPAPRLLAVATDDPEWQALSRELGGIFELVKATGKQQAVALLQKHPDCVGAVAWWGALGSGPDIMRAIAGAEPKLPRVLVSDRPRGNEAAELIAQQIVKAIVARPAEVLAALGPSAAPSATGQHPLRTEPRTAARVALEVSTPAWPGFLTLHTKDVSRGGAFFLYAQRVVPPMGAACSVKIAGATVVGSVAHVLTARLAQATHVDAGFGVKFSQPLAEDWWAPLVAKPAHSARAAPTAKELESAKNFASLADGLYAERNYAAARQKFELASRLAPTPRYEAMQAVCNGQQHARIGDSKKAQEAFERALQLDPSCEAATAAQKLLRR